LRKLKFSLLLRGWVEKPKADDILFSKTTRAGHSESAQQIDTDKASTV